MSIEQKLIILKKIINSNNEFRPSLRDRNWVIKNNFRIIKYKIKYIITDNLIKLMNNYTKIYNSVRNNTRDKIKMKYKDNIALIYLAKNIKSNEFYIGYTTNPLLTFIKLNLHKKNLNQENIFNYFKDKNPKNIIFKLLEFINYKTRKEILDRRLYNKKKYYTKYEILKRKIASV